jgi:CSLREA domain-containing protein
MLSLLQQTLHSRRTKMNYRVHVRQRTSCNWALEQATTAVIKEVTKFGSVGIALVIAVAMIVFGSGVTQAQSEASAGATLHIEAPAQVNVGEVVVLRVRIDGAAEVGGFEAQVLYSLEAAEFAGFRPQALAAEMGVGQLVVPDVATGAAVGFYTCGTEACLRVREAQASAASEVGVIAEIELLALQEGQLEIGLEHVQLVDRQGQRLALSVAQPRVVVQVGEASEAVAAPASLWQWNANAAAAIEVDAAAADITADNAVAHTDVMEVALAWHIVREDGLPCGGSEMAADINRDGCVDVVDVQQAAALVGSTIVPKIPDDATHLYLPFARVTEEEAAQAASPVTFIVDSTLDEYDIKAGNGVCKTASKVCTLRAAILEANYHPGPVTILFAIPGDGVHTIQLSSRLPSLWGGNTIIDGYGQPGSAPNTDPVVSNAQIRIELRGEGSEAFDGLAITSANNIVRGLSFYNLQRSIWIFGAGAVDNQVVGNFVGTDATGTFKANATSEQQAHGVNIEQGAQNNRIGGVLPEERNVISGNARHGVGLWHGGTKFNVIVNNLIGLSPDGTRKLPNRVHGTDINYGASHNRIGGLEPGERNVISGNNGKGAEISHGADTTQNTVIGNYIGTDVSGTAGPSYAANGNFGVSVKDRVVYNYILHNVIANNNGGVIIDNYGTCCASFNRFEYNRIGVGIDDSPIGNLLFGIKVDAPQSIIGPGNIIAYNPVGIMLKGPTHDGNTITRNSIYANTGLGIDINPTGQVNWNDWDDADSGPNEQLNFPVLASASPTVVTGKACISCTVEIFIADGGAGEYGEGRTFVGSGLTAADGTFSIEVDGVSAGMYVTSTATDAEGNTSEFSLNRLVEP